MTERSIAGKTVLIAGGGKNLSALIAKDFAAKGAKAIVMHYNSDATAASAAETVAAVQALGAKAVAIQANLSTAGAVDKLFADAIAAVGRPDIAINTVGMVLKKPMLEISEDEYDAITTLVTSLLGAYTPFYSSYAATKAPVEHFTRAASKKFRERGISVTATGTGPMGTSFFYGQEVPEAQAYHKQAAALSAFTKTGLTDIQDIVPWIQFLGTEGCWMTGQTVLVNGGYTTK
ncbi:SDR family oxidoreductase [Szabonella alba]|uniref:SDR family oxidoreductase n=1 Tax=Szabonella alba TaxID=2804194 RepID=A0A8K0VFN6_9RHOB|nr:SDR family oxidoreductase [Szabonella alba]MBL4919393.1 SDR family oxidoreductase [Szabonella alba]